MFRRLRDKKTDPLNEQITKVFDHMNTIGVDDEDYPADIKKLSELTDIQKKERRMPVSRDTLLTVAGSIVSVLIIVAYEQHHVITSKALSQIVKPRPN